MRQGNRGLELLGTMVAPVDSHPPGSCADARSWCLSMTRRQSECFRNLDDPLKIFSLLTVKSCGLVILFYGTAVATELVFGLWSLLFPRRRRSRTWAMRSRRRGRARRSEPEGNLH